MAFEDDKKTQSTEAGKPLNDDQSVSESDLETAAADNTVDDKDTVADEGANSQAKREEEGEETAPEAVNEEEYNDIVGATTKTVHEDITRFLDTFERSARRWEMIVYPAMFAFIILAGYGFFLIYSLTNNMNTIASSFDPKMAQNMSRLSDNMEAMTRNIARMTDEVQTMSGEIRTISAQMVYLGTMPGIEQRMVRMDNAIQRMSNNFEIMRYDMSSLNRNISKPMSFMNDVMPW